MNFLQAAVLAAGVAAAALPAVAAGPGGYPSRPVTIVVPFAPGGGSDNIARLLATRLGERTKGTFIIENKPGAGTNIGNEAVSRASPDGQTLLFGQVTLSINPAVYKGLRYNVQKDFTPIAQFATSPTVLVVTNAMPAKTVQEFVAYAKANPGKVNFGSGGAGTSVHLAGELFASLTGTQMVHIAYKGSAPAVTDLIGGQIQAIFDTAPSALPHIAGGKVRALAVTGPRRLAELPNVPTFAEAGVPGFDAPAWYGLLAPVKTPSAIVQYLNAEIQDILKEPATQQRLAQLGSSPAPGSADAFGTFIRTESERWSSVVRSANVTLE
ncbi:MULTISPECIES: Bug family tripartite tricarboxylate transporter substrate binding protein [Ramlibacter]|uniref:Tripartite tricarboxylate transporter substrate binding protein n=1 Tax=Ramlibacter pinisoli TaxID=2682844 RepID=A0A6N8J0R1_9BURK|nr:MULTISPECIES: tripartite tricarboxylate transporter substrate binding protein [Ramlibacter]MBA2961917.1 tripartite tricarboxylate transporter substrate binding protein [Ramlibacter sp. CGMCC 1.13660]MVQ31860.1 tripartite tricarboxylate transporter substrate binding protein [Ramlibacter pinisoli]